MAEHAEERTSELRRATILWIVVAALFAAAVVGTVASLNATVYSAPSFVRSYLDALARSDGRAALAHPGVTVPESGSRALLNGVALGELDDITLLTDEPAAGGARIVSFAYRTEGVPGSTEFRVRQLGKQFLVFDSWRFEQSPVATLRLQVRHATGFSVNGLDVPTDGLPEPIAVDGGPSGTEYSVLAPSTYIFDHESRYLDADPVRVTADEPGGIVDAAVTPRANPTFVEQTQREIDAYLTTCATQKVLLPAGCPFGKPIRDRIEGEPTWSIDRMPAVTLQPYSADPNDLTWLVPEVVGSANILVDVKSLFDGSVSTLDEEVPFGVSYRVTIQPDGTLSLAGL
jgi:hypothetical protein